VVFRLLRTIVDVIANPARSLTWKVVDLLFLAALLFVVVMVLLNPSADDLGYYFLLVPVVVLITCRSWYSMPRGRRQKVPPSEHQSPSQLSGPTSDGDAPLQAWDFLDDDNLAALSRPARGDEVPLPRPRRGPGDKQVPER